MKNLYSKSKPKKIHPSPSSSSSSAAAACLRLLPAAILALTAALSQEDKEVLAYLVMRSVGPTQEQSRRKRSSTGGGPHAPVIGCGCFDCYTSFWSRWDQSPNREVIHAAIDAFDDHLATSEEAKNKKGAKRKEKGNKGKSRKEVVVVVGPTCEEVQEEEVVSESGSEEEVVEDSFEGKVLKDGETVLEGCNEEEEERRKGYWAEVMDSMLNLRLWGIWSSAQPPPPPAAMETA